MIVDCNLLALNNPDDILPYPTYKSGLLDTDKGYVRFGYPSVSYPILNMPYILEDFEGNTLPSEVYVMQNFTQEQLSEIKDVLKTAKDAVEVYLEQGLNAAQTKFN